MPLHDWTDGLGWEGVHHLWIAELLRWIKPRLPAGYRAYIGSAPTVEVGAAPEKPDVGVREWPQGQIPPAAEATPVSIATEPDAKFMVRMSEPTKAVYVERHGRLAAAIELISPRNKDRPSSRERYLGRYLAYLLEGAHLLLVDVHPRPAGFSFADSIAENLEIEQPSLPPPLAVSYQVGDSYDSGARPLAVWRRPLTIGAVLPVMALPLTVDYEIAVDLEQTYTRAAAAYLS